MSRTRIKICGVRDPATALAAAEAGADAIGLAFVPRSPRAVDVDQARQIIDALPAFIEPVGLFLDTPVDEIRRISETLHLRTVQLHGNETPAQVVKLEYLQVIKGLPFDGQDFHFSAKAWADQVSNLVALLVDTPTEPGDLPGGTGAHFDWSALTKAISSATGSLPPLILAGGLAPETVAEAVQTLQPFGVDVSSGVESSRGHKDPEKIAAFCHAVRQADQQLSKHTPADHLESFR